MKKMTKTPYGLKKEAEGDEEDDKDTVRLEEDAEDDEDTVRLEEDEDDKDDTIMASSSASLDFTLCDKHPSS